MAFFNWGKKKTESVVKTDTKKEEPVKQVERPKPRPRLIDCIHDTDIGVARLTNIRENYNGVEGTLIINPDYIFPGSTRMMGGFSPMGYKQGLLVIDGIPSKISDIVIDINITEGRRYDSYDNGYHNYDYTRGYDRWHRPSSMLTFNRQVLSNAFEGMVSQTKKCRLTDEKYRVSLPVNVHVEISEYSSIRGEILNIIDNVKSVIIDHFRKEIKKSKEIELIHGFFEKLSTDIVTDIFQEITDLIPESKLHIKQSSIEFFVPLTGKMTKENISYDFNQKLSSVFYELSESSNRIKSYCEDSFCKIDISSDGITLQILPIVKEVEEVKSNPDEVRQNRMNIHRNPFSYYEDHSFEFDLDDPIIRR